MNDWQQNPGIIFISATDLFSVKVRIKMKKIQGMTDFTEIPKAKTGHELNKTHTCMRGHNSLLFLELF